MALDFLAGCAGGEEAAGRARGPQTSGARISGVGARYPGWEANSAQRLALWLGFPRL